MRHGGRTRSGLLAAGLVVALQLCGCPRLRSGPSPRAPRAAPPAPAARSFSDSLAVTAVALHAGHVYVGTAAGLRSFPVEGGPGEPAPPPLGTTPITALGASPGGDLWAVAGGSLYRVHAGAAAAIPLAPAPGGPPTVLLAEGGTVWLGGPSGLLLRGAGGSTRRLMPGWRVTALASDPRGGVFAGTGGQGLHRVTPAGVLSPQDARAGQPIRTVRALLVTPDGAVYAAGDDAQGRPRLAFFDGSYWIGHAITPPCTPGWLARAGDRVLLGCGGRVLGLHRLRPDAGRQQEPPSPGPLVLRARPAPGLPDGYPVTRLYTRAAAAWLPREVTAVATGPGPLLLGTPALGAVRLASEAGTPRWYRRADLAGGKARLGMVCAGSDCFLAGPGGGAFRARSGGPFRRFRPEPAAGRVVHLFAPGPGGRAVMVHAGRQLRAVAIARERGGRFRPWRAVEIPVPSGAPRVRVARVSPAGDLWLAVSYRDLDGQVRPFGVAVVPARAGAPPLFHRTSGLPRERRPEGSLAVPDDVRDIAFAGGDVWLATGGGVCRIRGRTVTVFTENEGLENEIAYAVAFAPGGALLAGTAGGTGRYSGGVWRFDLPLPLRRATRALLPEARGTWAATLGGLVLWRGGATARAVRIPSGQLRRDARDLYRQPGGPLWVLAGDAVTRLATP